jgi:hypothetical protein
LCGSQQKLTREHVPPKGLFLKPLPSNLVTVPCCFQCNNSYSKDDEYFRLAVSSLINANRIGKLVWKDRVIESTLNANRIKGLIDEVRRGIRPAVLSTSFGDLNGTVIPVRADIIVSVLIRMTKALLSIVHPEVDRDSLEFEVTQMDQFKLDSINASGVSAHFTHYIVGDGVYRHWRALSAEDTYFGIWVHMFYDAATWVLRHERKKNV